MYTILIVTKGTMAKVQSLMERAKNANAKIESILSYSGEGVLTDCAIQPEENERKQIEAYILGAMKANYDCLPEKIRRKQKVNDLMLDVYIKMRISGILWNVSPEKITEDNLVCEFAKGYSETFSDMAHKAGIHIEVTSIKQDISKNKDYFTDSQVFKYRLDGKYTDVLINRGVYAKLNKRSVDSFVEMLFAF